jgi:hypothetical protein
MAHNSLIMYFKTHVNYSIDTTWNFSHLTYL